MSTLVECNHIIKDDKEIIFVLTFTSLDISFLNVYYSDNQIVSDKLKEYSLELNPILYPQKKDVAHKSYIFTFNISPWN